MGSPIDAPMRASIAHFGIHEHTENVREISVSPISHTMQRYRGHLAVHSGNDCQNSHTGPDKGRSTIPEGSLVPIRRFHGVLPLGVRGAAYLRDAWNITQISLSHHPASTAAPDNDSLPQSLPKVFHAKKSNQPDFQTIQSANLQRHVVLPVLHVAVRIVGSTVLRRTKEPLRSQYDGKRGSNSEFFGNTGHILFNGS